MPIYEFRCKTCGLVTEEPFKISDCPPTVQCPNCGDPAEKAPPSRMNFQLKGGGWSADSYTTAKDKADLV